MSTEPAQAKTTKTTTMTDATTPTTTTTASPPSTKSAFFYGTLMAPQVLHRVCHGSMSPDNAIYATHNFHTQPAILPMYRRHRVKGADYPAILPHAASCVRGTYVTGLTDADIWRLDIFEGDEYEREKVRCRVFADDADVPVTMGDGAGEGEGEGEEVECETYIWHAGRQRLEDAEWDFAEFQREKMRFWVGSEGAAEYAEVDEAVTAAAQHDGTGGRGANGHITNVLNKEMERDAV